MTHGAGPHEEAEHAQHHSQDPFDRRVAMSMVVVAAVLAAVKVLGHRAHNDTLRYQIQANVHHTQANVLHTQANDLHTQESDQWNFFQAQKVRQHLYEAQSQLLTAIKEKENSAAKNWKATAKRYLSKATDIQKDANQLKAEARAKAHEAKEKEVEASELEAKSEHWHHRSDFFDLGELGVELALVLCSVAILSKRPAYWYGGLILGAIGVLVASFGFFAH